MSEACSQAAPAVKVYFEIDQGALWEQIARMGKTGVTVVTVGARRLAAVLKRGKLSQADVGRAVNAGRHLVCRWVSGLRRPVLRYALALQRVYGIPADSWEKVSKAARS